MGINDYCLFPGMVDNVNDWLCAFDIYVMTSSDEGFPLSVLEAMSCDLPVITTGVGNVADLIDDHIGRVMKSRTPEELGHILELFIFDESLRKNCGVGAREKVVLNYSIDTTLETYTDILM